MCTLLAVEIAGIRLPPLHLRRRCPGFLSTLLQPDAHPPPGTFWISARPLIGSPLYQSASQLSGHRPELALSRVLSCAQAPWSTSPLRASFSRTRHWTRSNDHLTTTFPQRASNRWPGRYRHSPHCRDFVSQFSRHPSATCMVLIDICTRSAVRLVS